MGARGQSQEVNFLKMKEGKTKKDALELEVMRIDRPPEKGGRATKSLSPQANKKKGELARRD